MLETRSVLQVQLRQACSELERRLRAGEGCGAEDLLAACPALAADTDSALELIYTEFVLRQELGEEASPVAFLARFPQWHDDLQKLFQVGAAVGASGCATAHGDALTLLPSSHPVSRGSPGPGRRLGCYELLEEIGRGGMGVVYKARQPGLNRIVALKVILSGEHAGPQELARFRTEGEAAARLHHPNIVQIFEVDEHEGHPFFVLEYADGGSLEDQLAEAPLPPEGAAALAETLARAMHHAHQRGVVHRDLKPTNILLTAEGAPKIADFGLAKRLGPGAGHTRTGAVVGTPSYMAPEQARGKGEEVGPATDVYALGAVLYEALTGRPPFQGATVLDTLEQVRSQEPVLPSRLQPKVPRDLETICLKCLEKNPAERYASAEALAEDLRRFQAHEPIAARPPGRLGRAWRWCRRHRAVALLSAAVILSLVVGALTATALAVLAVNRADEADRQRHLADANARAEAAASAKTQEALKRVEALSGKLSDALDETRRALAEADKRRKQYRDSLDAQTSFYLDKLLGEQKVLTEDHKQFLRHALQGYEALAAETGQDEESRAGVALAHGRVGSIRHKLGEYDEAEQAHRRAVALCNKLVADFAAAPKYRQALAVSHVFLGLVLQASDRMKGAEEEYRTALALCKELVADCPDVPEYKGQLAASHHNLGTLLQAGKRFKEAEVESRAALALWRQLAADRPTVLKYRNGLAASHNNLGSLLRAADRLEDAEREYRAALALQKQLAKDFPADPDTRRDLAGSHNNLGALLGATQRLKGAEAEYAAAVALLMQLAADFPALPEYRQSLAQCRTNLGSLFRDAGRLREAEEEYRAALALSKQLARDFTALPNLRSALAASHRNLGNLLRDTQRLKEAETEHRTGLALCKQVAADCPADADYKRELATSHDHLGSVLQNAGRPNEAEVEFRAGFALRKQLAADHPTVADYRHALASSHNNLGFLLSATQRLKEAEAESRAALALWRQLAAEFPAGPEYQQGLAGTMVNLATAHCHGKDYRAARRLLDEALPHHRAALKANPEHPDYRRFYRNNRGCQGMVLLALGDHTAAGAAAEQLAQAAVDPDRDPYFAACYLARCVSLAEKDDKLNDTKKKELTQQYGDRAMARLRQAVNNGFKDGQQLRKDLALASLRARADFRQLVAELEKNDTQDPGLGVGIEL